LGVDAGRECGRYAGAIIHAAKGDEGPSAGEAILWIYAYLEQVLREREKRPGEDLVSHLLRPGPGDRALDHDEVVGFCALLLMAGTQTTTNALRNASARPDPPPPLPPSP